MPHSDPRLSKVLVVDDEALLRASLESFLTSQGYEVFTSSSEQDARHLLEDGLRPELILLDVFLGPDCASGLELISEFKRISPSSLIVIMTAHGNIPDAVRAMQDGAYSYIEKPVTESSLRDILKTFTLTQRLSTESRLSSPKLAKSPDSDLDTLIEKVSRAETPVMILGESGTGKERVARAIHAHSSRRERPFVTVHCGALHESLADSILFGHEKGAFTGADTRKIGYFQEAEGGSLFLDEVSGLSPGVQVKLLRVLQDGRFLPLGSNREVKADVRIIASTHQDLLTLVRKGLFREDLYFRLNVIPIELPALRERREDIPRLVEYFLGASASGVKKLRGISQDALSVLQAYAWPGNIRELANTIERASVLEESNYLTLSSLPEGLREQAALGQTLETPHVIDFHREKDQFEKDFIIRALTRFGGRINQTVEKAGIPKNTLLRKIKKHGIEPSLYTES